MQGKNKKLYKYFSYTSLIVVLVVVAVFQKQTKIETKVKGAATPPIIAHALQVPNDPLYAPTQWNLSKVNAESAWNTTTGDPGLTIAVLDTGILSTQEDLAGKLVAGYDFVGNDSDSNPDPGGGIAVFHGSFVAGLIAANTNNGVGIAGACWNCKIMPIRVLDNDGAGSTDVIAAGIRYAADHGAKVINMSLGYPHADGPDYVQSAVDYAYGKGVVMVAAAGNDGAAGVNYPAACNHVIAVGATDKNDARASFSSFGPELDVMAPGVAVSSFNVSPLSQGLPYVTNNYGYSSGTSFAAPHVAALAGLIESKYATLTPVQVEGRIKSWTTKVSNMTGSNFTNDYGYGRVNFASALQGSLAITSLTNGQLLTTTSPVLSGQTDPSTQVKIYSNSTLIATVTSDSSGNWSYTFNNLNLGSYYFEAEATVLGATSRVGVSVVIDNKTPVYRFWNANGTHFYTASEAEKNNIIAKWPGTFKLEGVAYSLDYTNGKNTTPLYRFWNSNGTHFYTASEAEKNNIIAKWPGTFKFEGIAYNVSVNSANSNPVYRFWNNNGTHFYTASEAEKNNIIAKWPDIYKFEGVAFYLDN